jgi:hypothetical protein
MRTIDEISFEEFTRTMDWLHTCANESPQKYIQCLIDICGNCRLAGDMLGYLHKPETRLSAQHLSRAMEHHQAIIAIWMLLNGPEKFKDTIH